MYAKRSTTLRMMAQLGSPTFFLTLTAHESQPQLLLAAAIAHLHTLPAYAGKSMKDILTLAAEAVDALMKLDLAAGVDVEIKL